VPDVTARLSLVDTDDWLADTGAPRTAVRGGLHVGDTARLKTEGSGGHPMKVYVYRRQPAEVAAALRDAGFTVEAHMLLDPDGSLPGAVLFARCQP
jgi:hypothetical protein